MKWIAICSGNGSLGYQVMTRVNGHVIGVVSHGNWQNPSTKSINCDKKNNNECDDSNNNKYVIE